MNCAEIANLTLGNERTIVGVRDLATDMSIGIKLSD